MRDAGVGQVEHRVQFGGGERNRRRVEPNVAVAVALDQGAGVAGVGFQMQQPRSVRVSHRIVFDLLVSGQADDGFVAVVARRAALEPQRSLVIRGWNGAGAGVRRGRRVRIGIGMGFDRARLIDLGRIDLQPALRRAVADKSGAAHVADRFRRLAGGDAVGNFDDGALGVAIQQQIGLGVQQDRTPHLVRPVVVMGDPAQRGFDAADDDRRVGIGFSAALAIDDHRPVGPLAAFVVGGVSVVVAQAPIRGIAVDHRIHVARRDAEKQLWLPQGAERFGGIPVGLGDDPDPEALRFQQPADDRHAEARMIDVGVAGNQDDVAGIPTERIHFGVRHRQEGRDAEASGPVFAMGK